MKKLLCLLLCAAIMCSLFAGCASKDVSLNADSGTGSGVGSGSGKDPFADSPIAPPDANGPAAGLPAPDSPAGTPDLAPDAGEEAVFRVGYGRVDITPEQSVHLAGLGSEDPPRYSTAVKNQLYATCIAYTDEDGATALMFHLDLLNAYDPIVALRPYISAATGVPVSSIVIAATHNHSGPSYTIDSPESYHVTYRANMKQWLIDAAVEAMADRKPAQMFITTSYPENLTFVRHYINSDGTINGYDGSTSSLGHAEPADNQLQLIKFVREGGKDVLLMNWQGHPRGHGTTGNHYAVLSDVDEIRKVLEPELDCLFAYFLGASGNVNTSSRIKSEQRAADHVEHGQELASEAIDAAANFVRVDTGKVQTISQNVVVTPNDPDKNFTPYIETTAIAIGDVAFAIAGYEMFRQNGVDIKEGSPFEMTFVVTCANGDNKYIPSKATFAYPSYEGDATRYVEGTAETLANNYLSLLHGLKNAQ